MRKYRFSIIRKRLQALQETSLRWFFAALFIFVAVKMPAQTFTSLWSQAEKATNEDKPKSALVVLRQIESKAIKEKQYGHLLASLFSQLAQQQEISNDSLATAIKRIQENDAQLAKTDRVASLMMHLAIRKIERNNGIIIDSLSKYKEYIGFDNGSNKKSIVKELLADKSLVSQFTATEGVQVFMPLLEKHSGSNAFNHDLISFIAFQLDDYDALFDYYQRTNQRKAACITASKMLEREMPYGLRMIYKQPDLDVVRVDDEGQNAKKESALMVKTDSLINLFSDLKECALLATFKYRLMQMDGMSDEKRINWIDEALRRWPESKETNYLRNERNQMIQPSLAASLENITQRTTEDVKVALSYVKNISKIQVSVIPVVNCPKDFISKALDGRNWNILSKYLEKSKAKNIEKQFARHKEYEQFDDSVNLGRFPYGTYLVTTLCDGKELNGTKFLFIVSDLRVISIPVSKDKARLIVVDATTGHPVPDAELHLKKKIDAKEWTFSTSKTGEFNYLDPSSYAYVYPTKGKDNAQLSSHILLSYRQNKRSDTTYSEEKIFTDRAIYRPGQTVHASVLTYCLTNSTETKAEPNRKVALKLYDANNNQIGEAQLTTDDFGVGSTDFTLPERTLNGEFRILSENGNVWFRVEEYVRPTFDVTITKPETNYKHGDTLVVKGCAKTYSGVAVSNARVIYTVRRKVAWWWRMASTDNRQLLRDTVTTDAAGNFEMRMPMLMPENAVTNKGDQKNGKYVFTPKFFDIVAEASVTDIAGESHDASLSLPISNRTSILTSNLEEKMLIDTDNTVTFTRRNQAGTDIQGRVSINIDGKYMGEIEAGTEFTIPQSICSGKHTLLATCEEDTLKQSFVTFSLADKRPATYTKDWWYQTSDEFSVESGKPVSIQFGSSQRDVCVFYAMFSDSKLLESGMVEIDSSLVTRQFEYKEEYGKGLSFSITWVKDGEIYSHSSVIKRGLPEKGLKMTWSTFRNRLLPGQKEEWRLSVTDKDGLPVHANVMATLYDKSLDAIKPFSWSFSDNRGIFMEPQDWRTTRDFHRYIFASGRLAYKELSYDVMEFDGFNEKFFNLFHHIGYGFDEVLMAKEVVYGEVAVNADAKMMAGKVRTSYRKNNTLQANLSPMSKLSVEESVENGQEEKSNSSVRENLNETAFFLPDVRTNSKGIATLSFTLPESVTTWRFLAFASDKDMCYGLMKDEVIAQKELMIQPRVPRFLREGDVCMIPASVANTSQKDLNVKVQMLIIDSETEKTLKTFSSKTDVKAGESSAVSFEFDSKDYEGKMLIVRFTADAGSFKDGEQHYLPVLSSKEMVIDSKTFVMTSPGKKEIDVMSMLPKNAEKAHLAVEYTDAPEWLLIQSLPQIAEAHDKCAISLTTSYYVNSLVSSIAKSNPNIERAIREWTKDYTSLESPLAKNEELHNTILAETPWMIDAESEAAQRKQLYRLFDSSLTKSRTSFALENLMDLQRTDGSFAWWKGMNGNRYMTLSVLKSLLRLNSMVGKKQETSVIIAKAFNYLDKEIAKDVKRMKEDKKKHYEPYLSDFDLDYLYCRAICDNKMNATVKGDVDFMLDYVVQATRHDDMQTKANAAIALARFDKKQYADEYLESIMEHMVYKEDMGKYFDSYRAGYSWFDYRIPTQVAVIEALKALRPGAHKDIADMQRWLLQSKRTQAWDTPINAINAIYAFFGNGQELCHGMEANVTLGKETLQPQTFTTGLGYGKFSKDITEKSGKGNTKNAPLIIEKKSEGESWSNVYMKYVVPSTDVKDSSNGISVKREFSSETPKIGDKVTVTITITADRDYDFVTVTDNRPACFEPTTQLSGYRNGCYQVMKDSQSQYHFDMLSKGTHTIKTDYYVTKAGEYQTGMVIVQSAYAPVFCGRTKGIDIIVK